MPKRYKVTNLSATARRPSTRSKKVKSIKLRATICIFALLLAVVGIYTLVQYIRTDREAGGIEVIVGSQMMAHISAEDVIENISVHEALDAVAVRPTSMQTVVLTGPELDMEICADELESLKLFPGENCLELADEQGGRLGTLQRIYIPIDE